MAKRLSRTHVDEELDRACLVWNKVFDNKTCWNQREAEHQGEFAEWWAENVYK